MIDSRRIVQLLSLMAGLILALFVSYGLGAGQEPGTNVYFPLVSRPPSTIYGRVTYSGTAASGVILELRFYNGSIWSTLMSTTTNYMGNYQFQNVPNLAAGQEYLVRYRNTIDQSRLGIWETRHLTSPLSVGVVDLGSFDIADIELNSPIYGYEASLPRLFTWVRRPATPSDNYKFNLFDNYDYSPKFTSLPLGNTGSYPLNSLPPGFNLCIPYYWSVTVESPDGGWGGSLWGNEVTFYPAPSYSGIYGCVTQSGVPASGISVELHRLNIQLDTDVPVGTANITNGMFSFTGQPDTLPYEYYLVRYVNNTNVQNRVSMYETNWLGPYQAGSSAHIGDFDIANIALVAPGEGQSVALPYAFQWISRTATTTDDYQLYLAGTGGIPEYHSPDLGYVDHYSLTLPPGGFSTNTTYTWQVQVNDPFLGWGLSFPPYHVTFSSAGMSAATAEPQNVAGLSMLERMRQDRRGTGDIDRARRLMRVHPDYVRLSGQR